jgi:hypothetical protein
LGIWRVIGVAAGAYLTANVIVAVVAAARAFDTISRHDKLSWRVHQFYSIGADVLFFALLLAAARIWKETPWRECLAFVGPQRRGS